MGWLDDFGQGFAQGFVPTYTNRMAQQQRQEDALALKYMDKFSTVKAKNDKAAKVRKAQIAQARSIVNNIPQIENDSKAAMISYTTDLIVNGGMTNEKQIKDAVITAYQTNEFQKTGFRTDFSYDPDPYPIMPTTSGGIDTSKMSTMGKFFAESLGISKQASNKNIASTVKKEQIDNLETTTTPIKVEKVKVEEVEEVKAEEEKVSKAIPSENLSELEENIKNKYFSPPETDFTSWTNYRSELINRKTNPRFITNGEFDYGKRLFGPDFAAQYKQMGDTLFDEYLEDNPSSFTKITDFLSLDLEQVGMVYDLHKTDFVQNNIVPESHDWDKPLTKNQMKKIYALPEETSEQKVVKSRLKNIAISLEMQHLKKNNLEIDGILNPKNFPANMSLEDIREKVILVEEMFKTDQKTLDNSKNYNAVKSLIENGHFKSEQEINIEETNNKDPYFNISKEQIINLTNTKANRALLETKIQLAEITLNQNTYNDTVKSQIQNRISFAKDLLLKMTQNAPPEAEVDPYPQYSEQTIISFAGETGLEKSKSMLIAIEKKLSTPNIGSNNSKILKERKQLLIDKIKLFTQEKKSVSQILQDNNGKILSRENMLTVLQGKKLELEELQPIGSDQPTSLAAEKFLKKEIDLLTKTIKVLGQNEGTFKSVKVAKLNGDGVLVMEKAPYTFNGLYYRDGNNNLVSSDISKTLIQVDPGEFTKFKGVHVEKTSDLITRSNNNVALFSNIADAYHIIETNENVTNPFNPTITDLKITLKGGAKALEKVFGTFDPRQEGDGESRTIEQATSVIQRAEGFTAGQKALMVKTLSIVYGLAGARGSTGMALSDREMANIMKTVIVNGDPETAKAILRGHVQEAFRNYEAQRSSTQTQLEEAGYQFTTDPFYLKDSKEHFMEVFEGAEGTHGNALEYFDEMLSGTIVDFSSLENNQNTELTVAETLEINTEIENWVGTLENKSELFNMYKDMKQDGTPESKRNFINIIKRIQGFPVSDGVDYEAPLLEFLESTVTRLNKLRETN